MDFGNKKVIPFYEKNSLKLVHLAQVFFHSDPNSRCNLQHKLSYNRG